MLCRITTTENDSKQLLSQGTPVKKKTHRLMTLVLIEEFDTNLTNSYFISATFRTCFFSLFSSFNYDNKKVQVKNYNKLIPAPENSNIQSDDQEECKLNSTIDANSDAHTLTDDNKNNVAIIKSK